MINPLAPAHARKRAFVVSSAILLLAAISFSWFPGHTILQSDTQIYIPILQHLEDPSALANDIMSVRPHLSYSLYDEIALGLRRTTGLEFETLLLGQQLAYRAIGIWGIYLLGTGVGFGTSASLVLAALCSLGATVLGPAVLTVEYEPIPRGFAMPFLLLSMGALAHGRTMFAAGAATAGFALHPPTVLAYCGILFCVLVWKREWRALGVLMAGPTVILLTLIGEPPAPEKPSLFAHIDPQLERLQRMRAPYNWVSLWIGRWWGHYAILTAALAVAFYRIRDLVPLSLRVVFTTLPVIGWLALPVSWFCLERMKWAVIPQYQPARHLLFVTLLAVITCAIAAIWAGIRRRYLEAFLFCLIPLIVPQTSDLTEPSAVAWMLAAGIALMLAFGMTWKKTAFASALLPFLLIPTISGVENHPQLHSQDLDDLAAWARSQTPKDAVFQFADAGRQLAPGVFRARAVRALYADWKSGGQSNFLKSFAETWAERWAMASKPQPLQTYRQLGIDYVVFSAAKAPKGAQPVYSNGGWTVFRTSE
jgi:hypothetical protein